MPRMLTDTDGDAGAHREGSAWAKRASPFLLHFREGRRRQWEPARRARVWRAAEREGRLAGMEAHLSPTDPRHPPWADAV